MGVTREGTSSDLNTKDELRRDFCMILMVRTVDVMRRGWDCLSVVFVAVDNDDALGKSNGKWCGGTGGGSWKNNSSG